MTTDTHMLESTRRLASEALERASNTVRDLRSSVADVTTRGVSVASDRAATAQRYMGEYARSGTRYVADHPLKAALVAAAVGAIVAGVILALRRRGEDDNYL